MSKEQDTSRQSDLAVMDAEEYKNKRRLRSILDAHDKVEEKEDEANELYVDGIISKDGRNIMILNAVQQYIREVYNLLLDYREEFEAASEDEQTEYTPYLTGRDLGEIQLANGQDPIAFTGLWDVLQAREMYYQEWTETEPSRYGGAKTVTHTESYSVPKQVSMRAFMLVNEFLSRERGMEVEFETDELPTWGFEEVDDIPGTEEFSDAEVADGD